MIELHKLIISFILGAIEGLTEFLPISSTGHIILVKILLDHTYDIDTIFVVVTQLGAIFSIVLIFWRRLYRMGFICTMELFLKKHYGDSHSHLCLLHILVGTLPGVFLGALFFDKIKLIFDLKHVMYGLVAGGIFLFISERYFFIKAPYVFHVDNITYFQAFLVGCFQCLAFFPGFSRSGATIGGGLLVGLDRSTSLKFSFFLSVPIIFGAVVLTIYYDRAFLFTTDFLFLLVGCIVSFVISVFTVKFFLKIVQSISFIPFIIYRFLLAGSIYWALIV